MTSPTSVVTPARYDTGMDSYQEWLASAAEDKRPEFEKHYQAYEPKAEDIAVIKGMVEKHGVKAMVIGTDWCPDVWRGLPVIARIGEASGMPVRYFERDQNKDIMAEFLNQGEFESVPTVVFYDGDHNYLFHFIERPVTANAKMAELRKEILEPAPQEDGPEKDAARAKYRQATADLAGQWRHDTLSEIRANLESKLK